MSEPEQQNLNGVPSEMENLPEVPALVQPDIESQDELAKTEIDGDDLLLRVHAFLRRFVCYPSEASSIAHVLWIAHTHLMDAWFSTPRLAVLSPEPGSGKSRLLEMTALLVPRPQLSVNSSAAYILRRIADHDNRPTILLDEVDAIYGPNGRGNEDLRSTINAGYRRGATVGRCYTDKGKVYTEELPTYAAVAMGGLGDLPSTIMSRSIVIRMRKRAPSEVIEPFQPSLHEALGQSLNDELADWALSVAAQAAVTRPALPSIVVDRHADVWSPLLTVAELAGGSWLDVAKDVAVEFVEATRVVAEPSIGVQLLADIRNAFGEVDRMATKELLARLLADEEAPWGDLAGKKLDARRLGKLLRPFGIRSTTIRLPDDSTPKGYRVEAFHDPWKRYLPGPESSATSASTATER
jgi:hypothetical protein